MSARLHLEGPQQLIVSCLPLGSSASRIADELWQRMQRHRAGSTRRGQHEDAIRHVIDVTDNTTEAGTRIEIRLAADAHHDAVTALLHGLWAIRHNVEVAFDGPLSAQLAAVARGTNDDLAERLHVLESATRPPR